MPGIWKAVVTVAGRSLTIVESDKSAGVLKAEKGVGLTTWGEVVGIYVRPATGGATAYTVEVQSLKRSRAQITGQDWTTTMVSGMLLATILTGRIADLRGPARPMYLGFALFAVGLVALLALAFFLLMLAKAG